MKYTINGKEYSEFEIKVRCAELMGFKIVNQEPTPNKGLLVVASIDSCWSYDPLNNPADAWPIIEKVRDELLNPFGAANWARLRGKHKCSMLTAACICFIDVNATGRSSESE